MAPCLSRIARGQSCNDAAQAHSFPHAFISSMAVIIVSELGDKTFFIAAIMAMRCAHHA